MGVTEGDRPMTSRDEGSSGESSLSAFPRVSLVPTDRDERVTQAPIPVELGPYDPRPHTTRMRGRLAIGMTVILGITVIASFALAWFHQALGLTIEQVNGFTAPILSTEAALLGTALGFYFGDRSSP